MIFIKSDKMSYNFINRKLKASNVFLATNITSVYDIHYKLELNLDQTVSNQLYACEKPPSSIPLPSTPSISTEPYELTEKSDRIVSTSTLTIIPAKTQLLHDDSYTHNFIRFQLLKMNKAIQNINMGSCSDEKRKKIKSLLKMTSKEDQISKIIDYIKENAIIYSTLPKNKYILFMNGYYDILNKTFVPVIGKFYNCLQHNFPNVLDLNTNENYLNFKEYLINLQPDIHIRSLLLHEISELLYDIDLVPNDKKTIVMDGGRKSGIKTFSRLLTSVFKTTNEHQIKSVQINTSMYLHLGINALNCLNVNRDNFCVLPFDTYFAETIDLENLGMYTNLQYHQKIANKKLSVDFYLETLIEPFLFTLIKVINGDAIDDLYDPTYIKCSQTKMKNEFSNKIIDLLYLPTNSKMNSNIDKDLEIINSQFQLKLLLDEIIDSGMKLNDCYYIYKVALRNNYIEFDTLIKILNLYDYNPIILLDAVRVGNELIVDYCLEELSKKYVLDVNVYNSIIIKYSFLQAGINLSKLDLVDKLVEFGGNLYINEFELYNIAVKSYQVTLIKYLIEHGVSMGHHSLLILQELLINYNKFSNTSSDTETLHLIKLLIDYGIDIYQLNDKAMNMADRLNLIPIRRINKITDKICCISTDAIQTNEEYIECTNNGIKHAVTAELYKKWDKYCPACFKPMFTKIIYTNK